MPELEHGRLKEGHVTTTSAITCSSLDRPCPTVLALQTLTQLQGENFPLKSALTSLHPQLLVLGMRVPVPSLLHSSPPQLPVQIPPGVYSRHHQPLLQLCFQC